MRLLVAAARSGIRRSALLEDRGRSHRLLLWPLITAADVIAFEMLPMRSRCRTSMSSPVWGLALPKPAAKSRRPSFAIATDGPATFAVAIPAVTAFAIASRS